MERAKNLRADGRVISFGPQHFVGLWDTAQIQSTLLLGSALREQRDEFVHPSLVERPTHSATIQRNQGSSWIFERFERVVKNVNVHYQFEIAGIEPVATRIRYVKDDFLAWHIDCGGAVEEGGKRKISLVVQLSSHDAYTGGDLEFAGSDNHIFARTVGTTVAFPSFLSHQVTALLGGTRDVLVGFAYGPPFR